MAEKKRDADRQREDIDREAIAAEGERGSAGAGRRPGGASTEAGAATADDSDTPEFPSTPANQPPHRGRGTGLKDKPPGAKIRVKE